MMSVTLQDQFGVVTSRLSGLLTQIPDHVVAILAVGLETYAERRSAAMINYDYDEGWLKSFLTTANTGGWFYVKNWTLGTDPKKPADGGK